MPSFSGQVPDIASRLEALGCQLIVRGWLSANSLVFCGEMDSSATVIDTGYDSHSAQTLALLAAALHGRPLGRIINTHLHSDHCGGNAALQSRWRCDTWVPAASFDAASTWDAAALSFNATGQTCKRFQVDHAIMPGDEVALGGNTWTAVEAPGHDPHALMLFEPRSKTLISGDALWEQRLAIIFPELIGEEGFAPALALLEQISRMAPSLVIPGHGDAFTRVAEAIENSRQRIKVFQRAPQKHTDHAIRALLMFHMLEFRERHVADLLAWISSSTLFCQIAERGITSSSSVESMALDAIASLEKQGRLVSLNGRVKILDQ